MSTEHRLFCKNTKKIQQHDETMSPKNKFPLVTILTPLYNHEQYIVETLDSIISDDYPNLELLLVDDASKDNGLKIAKKKLSSTNFNYQIFENKINLGICKTLNLAISKARGEYVCFVASDDLIAKGRIRRHIQILENSNDPRVIGCFGKIQKFRNNSKISKDYKPAKENITYSLEKIINKTSKLSLLGCTLIKEKIKKLPFDENLFFEDWDFFIRVFLYNYKIIYDQNISGFYRINPKGTNLNVEKMIESRNKIKRKYYEIIAKKDKKLASSFSFTIKYWNLVNMSYQGNIVIWLVVLIKLFIKNPISTIKKSRDIFWGLRNLLKAKLNLYFR